MTVIISGSSGITDVNGSAAAPAITGTDTDTGVFFGTNTVSLSTGGTERLQVDSSGNLGLGVTPSAWGSNARVVQVAGGGSVFGQTNANILTIGDNMYWDNTNFKYIATDYASKYVQYQSQHLWFTAASGTAGNSISFTQAMTLDSSGNLLVGTTDASVGSGPGIKLRPTGDGVSLPIFIVTTGGSTSASAPIQLYSTGAGAYRFYVNAAGTIFATSTTITAISDQRLKENIQDLDVGLDAVMALKPRKFDWKPGKGKDKKGDRGWIAQEFEQVFPDMIDEWRDPAPEGEEPYKAVNADLIPVLVKAIQEQQAIITQLQADVAALKAQ